MDRLFFIFYQHSNKKLFPLSGNGTPNKGAFTDWIANSFRVLNKLFNNSYAWCDLVLLNVMPKEQTELVIHFLVRTQFNARDIEWYLKLHKEQEKKSHV